MQFHTTRHERLMLRALMEANGRTVTRDHLLNCVSGIGSDAGDRNVDFVINRLRRLTTFLIEKFGPHVVPAEIMADLSPDLAAHI